MLSRIVIYGMNYAPEFTGVGRYTGEIGEHLAATGHEVSVVTTGPHYPGWKERDGYSARKWSKETVAGATVFRCPLYLNVDMKGFKRLLAPLSFALSSAPVAFYQILKQRPHVVLAIEPTLFVAPIALLAGKLAGAKVVLHVQDLEIDAAFAVGHLRSGGMLAKLGAAFERMVMKGFDRVVTISHRMAEKIVEKGVRADRVEMIRNWVDVDRIKPLTAPSPYRAEFELTDKEFVVLYAGAIGAKQGVGLLIDAARLLADRRDIVFVVAGDGPMRSTLEEAAKSLPNLRVKPFQPEERFSDFLGLADLHVLPQERGAADLLLPSKLGGMLASGRRILVTADEGTELALFLGDSCVFVPPGDAGALAMAITRQAETPMDEDATAARLQRAASLAKSTVIERFVAAVTEWPVAQTALNPNEKH
jgi:colanic acid biosynthesis glycosyl transferase WcaI